MGVPRRTLVLSRTTRAPIPVRLRDAAGTPIPLTDATITLVLTTSETGSAALTWTSGGVLRHQPDQVADAGWFSIDPPAEVLAAMLDRHRMVGTIAVATDPSSPRTWVTGDVFMED